MIILFKMRKLYARITFHRQWSGTLDIYANLKAEWIYVYVRRNICSEILCITQLEDTCVCKKWCHWELVLLVLMAEQLFYCFDNSCWKQYLWSQKKNSAYFSNGSRILIEVFCALCPVSLIKSGTSHPSEQDYH